MALTVGTNCGFVTTAPTTDPGGIGAVADTRLIGFKVTAPTGAGTVTELGWWCDTATEAGGFDLGVYTHDDVNNTPEDLIGTAAEGSKGTDAGWKVVSGLSIPITAGNTYWLCQQCDDTATQTNGNYNILLGQKRDYKAYQTSLPSNWGASAGTSEVLWGIYAVWTAGGGTNSKINIGDAWKTITAIKINIGNVWKAVTAAKINIADAWKTIF